MSTFGDQRMLMFLFTEVPVCVLEELQKLCDQVPCYPTKDAIALIEAELKKPIDELFDGIEKNTEPTAGASLGQVYKCKIKNTDHVVAVKGKT